MRAPTVTRPRVGEEVPSSKQRAGGVNRMQEETKVSLPPAADPAALGLGAFALTTFLLSASNAKLTDGIDAWVGFAFAYGGFIQLLAGMWEFRNRNVFGATAFSTYGGFWIGLGLWFLLIEPRASGATAVAQAQNDLGWILLAFSIFNTYMLLWSTRVNVAVFLVFLTLEATEIILWLGFFSGTANLIKLGGWVGIVTALVADNGSGHHPDMMRKVEGYARWGVDGFIMKTPEAMAVVHDRFPEITIHASVGCNVRSRSRMKEVKEAGATQFVASTALNTFDRIAALKATADEVGIGVELLIHSNRCVTGVGGCRLYDYFGPYFEEQIVHDSDGSHRVKLIGNPDKGGVCYRPCLGTHIPEIYQLLEDIPNYMALGVTTLKIQGREYPPEVIAELTRLYRRLVDEVNQGKPDISSARADLERVLPDRDRTREAKTQELHLRLLTGMGEGPESDGSAKASKVCYACGAREEELHRTSVFRVETTEWDPGSEETALLGGESGG